MDLDERLKDWAEHRSAPDPSAGSTAALIRRASEARRGSPWLRVLLVVPLLVAGWWMLRDEEPALEPAVGVEYALGHQIGVGTAGTDRLAIAEGRLNFSVGEESFALDRRSELALLEPGRWELVKGTLAVQRPYWSGGGAPRIVRVAGHDVELGSGAFLLRNEPEGSPSVWALGTVRAPDELELLRGDLSYPAGQELWRWLIEEEPEATHLVAEDERRLVGVDTILVGAEPWTELLIYGRRVEVLRGAVAIDAFEEVSLLHGPKAQVVGPGTFTGDARDGAFVVGAGDPLGLLGERTGPALDNPAEAWMELADRHEQQAEPVQAREAYEAVLQVGGPRHRTLARQRLGRLAERQAQDETAIGHYNAALSDGPGELENEIRLQLIEVLVRSGREDEAELHRGLLR
jgi:hypothetical protein